MGPAEDDTEDDDDPCLISPELDEPVELEELDEAPCLISPELDVPVLDWDPEDRIPELLCEPLL